MKKIGIFYGSDTGNSETIAKQLQKEFGEENAELFDVADADKSDLEKFSNIIFGASTQGIGDMQGNFDEFMEEIKDSDLDGKVIAIYGLGDAEKYPDTFVDAIGMIYELIKDKGCKIIGKVSIDDYEFDESMGEKDGKFVGLPIDEDNEDDKTEGRINNWVAQLKKGFN